MTELTLNEILKQVGDSEELKAIVKKWINYIEEKGVKIGTRSDTFSSSYENYRIRISVRHDASKGVGVLWDLLHEFGHHLDPDLSNIKTTPREYRAWMIAKKLLENEDIYKRQIESFDLHMNNKLISYRKDDLFKYFKKECIVKFINTNMVSGEFQTFNVKERAFCLKCDKDDYRFYPFDEIIEVKSLDGKYN